MISVGLVALLAGTLFFLKKKKQSNPEQFHKLEDDQSNATEILETRDFFVDIRSDLDEEGNILGNEVRSGEIPSNMTNTEF
jgi:hypothetical protein